MKNQGQSELILGRFQKLCIHKKTNNKEIWLLQNATSNEKIIGKFQAKSKLDKVNTKNVLHQASFLQQMQGHSGIPLMYWSGVEGNQIVVISQFLGYTLTDRLNQCGGKFSVKTTCMIGIIVINLIRNLHEKGLIHRNINPNSFQFGRGLKSSQLFFNDLIDCKKYRNKKSYTHIPSKKGIKYSYQNRFGSMRFHQFQQLSRIDDIESTIKMLIYFITGVLPSKKGQYKNEQIPHFLKEMLWKCHSFQFSQDPVYDWFIQKLNSVLFHHSQQNDYIFDWILLPQKSNLLKVNKNIISLKLEQDKQILAYVYDQYEQQIDIDQISSKHHKSYGLNQGIMPPNPVQAKKSHQLQQKLKKRKTSHRQKPDCSIM